MTKSTYLGLILALSAVAACAGDDDGGGQPPPPVCIAGSTQGCVCSDGASGAQQCAGDAWGQCVCDGTPLCSAGETQSCVCDDGATGSQGCVGGQSWSTCECQSMPTGPQVGDPCEVAENCEGGDRPMRCVLQNATDIQGICTVICSDWTDCTSGEIGQPFWDCCDLDNGSFACAPDEWGCGI